MVLPFNQLSDSEFQSSVLSLRHNSSLVQKLSELHVNPLDGNLRSQLGSNGSGTPCNYYTEEEFVDLSRTRKMSLSLFFNNCRSMNANSESIFGHIHSLGLKFDILGFCETFLNSETEKLYGVSDYKSYHANRIHRSGGGVSLYIRLQLVHSR